MMQPLVIRKKIDPSARRMQPHILSVDFPSPLYYFFFLLRVSGCSISRLRQKSYNKTPSVEKKRRSRTCWETGTRPVSLNSVRARPSPREGRYPSNPRTAQHTMVLFCVARTHTIQNLPDVTQLSLSLRCRQHAKAVVHQKRCLSSKKKSIMPVYGIGVYYYLTPSTSFFK